MAKEIENKIVAARTEHQQEILSMRPRKISLNLSDADCKRLVKSAGRVGVSVEMLLERFIGDLIDGTYSGGSTQRALAGEWYNQCFVKLFGENTLLKYLISEEIDVKEFLNLSENIENAERELVNLGDAHEEYPEEIKDYKTVFESWKDEFHGLLQEYIRKFPQMDISKEMETVRKWYKESLKLQFDSSQEPDIYFHRRSTGMCDMEGREVFEEDIIECHVGMDKVLADHLVIKYGTYQAYCPVDQCYVENVGFYAKGKDEPDMPIGSLADYAKVIGNTIENSELVEKGWGTSYVPCWDTDERQRLNDMGHNTIKF